jgi:hypothetical protein
MVEGVGFDIKTGSGCPTYTDLQVTPPDTTPTPTQVNEA